MLWWQVTYWTPSRLQLLFVFYAGLLWRLHKVAKEGGLLEMHPLGGSTPLTEPTLGLLFDRVAVC